MWMASTAKSRINGLTKTQVSELRRLLEARRAELIANIQHKAATGPKVEPDQVIEELDQAAASQNQAVTLRVMDKEVKLLRQVNFALAKFDTGEYGLCEETEEPIGYKRLKVVPWTRYSVAYKEQREQQQMQNSSRPPGR
jgi:DnaK suppressor protein